MVVCTGQFSSPFKPEIPGLKDLFEGEVMHSHDYRIPDRFKDKTVIVLGAAASGSDIAHEIASVAKKVYLSHNNEDQFLYDLEQVRGIKDCIGSKAFHTADGKIIQDVDSLILCTGYRFDYGFLAPECGIDIEDSLISPLFKHLININHPSMAFIGVISRNCPFPQFHYQALLYSSMMAGQIQMPPKDFMMAELKKEMNDHLANGKKLKHFHRIMEEQWVYTEELAALAKADPLPKFYDEIFNLSFERRTLNYQEYRNDCYSIADDGSFIRLND